MPRGGLVAIRCRVRTWMCAMSEPARIHDFIAVGVGPFNLGLACLASAIEGLDGLFLDQKAGFDWHPGLMFDDAHLQTPSCRISSRWPIQPTP